MMPMLPATARRYKTLRNRYKPQKLKAIFVLESPPVGGGYFYNPSGKVGELLFREMLHAAIDSVPTTKEEGLRMFAEAGYLLVDPIYIPVDKLPDKEADALILKNYPAFVRDLKSLTSGKPVPLILIKKNICTLLEPRLTADGFNVLNRGVVVPFPLHYHFKQFRSTIQKILKEISQGMPTTPQKALREVANPLRAKVSMSFFKTKKGEYGEGDIFLGVTMPEQHRVAKQFTDLSLGTLQKLLHSKIHEERMVALLIAVRQFEKGDEKTKKKLYTFFIKNRRWINNWDLVDVTVPRVIGAYLKDKPRDILYTLARSANLWDKRIAIISTFHFIRQGDFADTLAIASILLADKHDLIHKAVGWMLREVGKKSLAVEKKFLNKYAAHLPRTTLRYAIERFPLTMKKQYMRIKKSITL